ncbi:low-density lipoprotein receptor-related protein 11-like [Zerene cesonia]|uniref:low-density lipoprotein receptor-related protein 11-like n=1 Tax=Zerene cesonia TaxID=33412 RepID=UPI0018E5689C|nr:low-density lipoprotein receptor-related protein 11-like [Zerene cesonia]
MLPVLLWVWLSAAAQGRELDPAACAARFDVQRDKIIRTEESREMGARYLSELDVGSRRECLRLCCETDGCDVFVFEEKSPGSCYLFKCGPPEDFRCKFTAHGNFSSGVLALSRRLAELQDQERLAPPDPPDLGRLTTTSTVRPSAPARPPEAPPQPPRQQPHQTPHQTPHQPPQQPPHQLPQEALLPSMHYHATLLNRHSTCGLIITGFPGSENDLQRYLSSSHLIQ